MNGVLAAPVAEFLQFQFPLNSFFILAGMEINAVADRAFKFN